MRSRARAVGMYGVQHNPPASVLKRDISVARGEKLLSA